MDKVIELVKQACQKTKFIQKAWLFGSRAFEKSTDKSDYDFAFETKVNEVGPGDWGLFCSSLREKNPTLNTLDLVRFDEISEEFKSKIKAEGRVIYEQT